MNNNENKTSSASHCRLILAHLKQGNTLTALEALTLFGTMKAATRISELKKRGHNIITTMIVTPRSKKKVAQYSMPYEG